MQRPPAGPLARRPRLATIEVADALATRPRLRRRIAALPLDSEPIETTADGSARAATAGIRPKEISPATTRRRGAIALQVKLIGISSSGPRVDRAAWRQRPRGP